MSQRVRHGRFGLTAARSLSGRVRVPTFGVGLCGFLAFHSACTRAASSGVAGKPQLCGKLLNPPHADEPGPTAGFAGPKYDEFASIWRVSAPGWSFVLIVRRNLSQRPSRRTLLLNPPPGTV